MNNMKPPNSLTPAPPRVWIALALLVLLAVLAFVGSYRFIIHALGLA